MSFNKSGGIVLKALYCIFYAPLAFGLSSIPILMYHGISDQEGRYNVSPEIFRQHLQKLCDLGFVTAKLEDVILNKENIKNKKIVILRFDDSRKNQFNYIKDHKGSWVINPECAVGIILDFYKKNPKFGKHAIFFVIPKEEFHQRRLTKKKMKFLLSQGMEIGNHTYYHDNLKNAQVEDVDRNFGQAMAYWEDMLGADADKIKILSTPYGVTPDDSLARERLRNFQWKNKTYKPIGILLAGKDNNKLCPIPNCKEFDCFAIPSLEVTNKNFDSIVQLINS